MAERLNAPAFGRDVPGSTPGGVGHFLSAMSLGKTDSPSPWVRSLGLCTVCHRKVKIRHSLNQSRLLLWCLWDTLRHIGSRMDRLSLWNILHCPRHTRNRHTCTLHAIAGSSLAPSTCAVERVAPDNSCIPFNRATCA